MNNTMPLSKTSSLNCQAAPRHSAAPSVFTRLLQAVAAFILTRDDPAALRYAAAKYDGRCD